MKLNENAMRVVHELVAHADRLHVTVAAPQGDACVIDCGVEAPGGLDAGRRLAEACLAGLARVRITHGNEALWSGPWVSVTTDHPLAACMASQYAGWPLSYGDYFAMGSGPMRARAGASRCLNGSAAWNNHGAWWASWRVPVCRPMKSGVTSRGNARWNRRT